MSGSPAATSSTRPDPAPARAPASGGTPSGAAGARPGTGLRQLLVVVLAVVSGATDAIGLLALGGAFTSVMTGNLVILGVSASSADGTLAIASGGAILAFCAGAALGARLAGAPMTGDPVWPRPVTVALTVELGLLTAYAVGWWVTGGEPGPVLTLALLFTMSAALGIQSSTVQRFGVSGMSTTYLTGTLTTVVIRLASGRGLRESRASVEILLGLIAGAAAGAGLLIVAPLAAPALQLAALGGVVAVAALVAQRR
ncbi:MAG TPA: YoaK family protein [Geodermatophilus sp.]|nr:YoaK family protein [Geodermatophilus sp.]